MKGPRHGWIFLAALLAAAALRAPEAPAAPEPMTRDEIICLAQSGVGYSYWWGNGRWCRSGCSPDFSSCSAGSCSGNCPSCTHYGSYGADCSGYVAKVWQVPNPSSVSTNTHPYSTQDFYCTLAYWSTIGFSSLERGDAMVRRNGCPGSSGHVLLYESGDSWGSVRHYEASGCSTGIVHHTHGIDTDFKCIRRVSIGPACTPSEEVCDGADNDCDGTIDEDVVCLIGWDLDSPGSSDVDGDGLADICARAAAGVRCYLSTGGGFSSALVGPELSNDAGWDDIDHYATIRMGDVTGDGMDDVCARGNAGIFCWASTGDGFGSMITGPTMSDDFGWHNVQYWSTIKLADINGDGMDDICARAAAGITCYLSSGSGFATRIDGPALSDDTGWDDLSNYGTIRFGDINGDGLDDVCARGNAGMFCWPSTGDAFGARITGPTMSDDFGWHHVQHWSTIKLADINGDGMDDICARAAAGITCYLSSGGGFGTRIDGPALSNDSGWSDQSNYGTIRFGDINGDGMDDVCARGNAGVFCWPSTGDGFGDQITGPVWSDDTGWSSFQYWSTIRLADIDGDGMDDICARAARGINCHLSTGGGFGGTIEGPAMSNDSGWNRPMYFSTIQLMTSDHRCVAGQEVCDGVDNDCDGEVDEGCGPDDTADDAAPDAADASDMADPAESPDAAADALPPDVPADGDGDGSGMDGLESGCSCALPVT